MRVTEMMRLQGVPGGQSAFLMSKISDRQLGELIGNSSTVPVLARDIECAGRAAGWVPDSKQATVAHKLLLLPHRLRLKKVLSRKTVPNRLLYVGCLEPPMTQAPSCA